MYSLLQNTSVDPYLDVGMGITYISCLVIWNGSKTNKGARVACKVMVQG
jgi:hypothetical protein